MVIQKATVVIWQGKIFVPSLAESEGGLTILIDPVIVIPCEENLLTQACMNVLATPRPKVPDRNREEWKNWKDPVLTATQAKSWKALAKEGASYAIDITLSNIYLEMSRVDKQGRWEYDPQRRKVFALDTPIREVVQVILEDWTRQKTLSEKKDTQ